MTRNQSNMAASATILSATVVDSRDDKQASSGIRSLTAVLMVVWSDLLEAQRSFVRILSGLPVARELPL